MSPPPREEPVVSRALDEQPDQRYVGDRDLTAWPTAAGSGLARLRERLTPHAVLLVALAVGLVLAAGLTALAGAVYDAVTEDDGVAARPPRLADRHGRPSPTEPQGGPANHKWSSGPAKTTEPSLREPERPRSHPSGPQGSHRHISLNCGHLGRPTDTADE